MSTRYVWNKYTKDTGIGPVDTNDSERLFYYGSGDTPVEVGDTIYINISDSFEYSVDDDGWVVFKLTGNIRKQQVVVESGKTIDVNTGDYFISSTEDLTTHRMNYVGVEFGRIIEDTKLETYVNPYGSVYLRIQKAGWKESGFFMQTVQFPSM